MTESALTRFWRTLSRRQDAESSSNAAKCVFLIGMRRSGTTILREVVKASPDVGKIFFEPHELFDSIRLIQLRRYQRGFYQKTVRRFQREFGSAKVWKGAKIALNPGLMAMSWRRLDEVFEELRPRHVFIIRNPADTYKSWVKVDKSNVRGIFDYEMYLPLFRHITGSFEQFTEQHEDRACVVSFDAMVSDPQTELLKIWNLLEARPPSNLEAMIKKPENFGGAPEKLGEERTQ